MGLSIIYVTSRFPFGPGEPWLVEEIAQLVRLGADVTIVPIRAVSGVTHGDAEGSVGRTIRESLLSREVLGGALAEFAGRPLRTLHALSMVLRSRNVLVLAKNLAAFAKGLWLAKIAREKRVTHIHACWSSVPATVALVASVVSRISWSFSAHRFDIAENNLLTLKMEHSLFGRFSSCEALNCVAGITPPVHRNIVLRLGVHIPDVAECAGHLRGSPSRITVLVCPAMMIERKGQVFLLHAFRRVLDRGLVAELWLVGDGPCRETLEKVARDIGIAAYVRFLGILPHDQLLKLYSSRSVDIVVLPSLHEGVPACLPEAMVHQIPVIGTEVGGVPELLMDGAGLMVQPRAIAELTEAIVHLLLDPSERLRIGNAGRARVRKEFDVRAVGQQLIERMAYIREV